MSEPGPAMAGVTLGAGGRDNGSRSIRDGDEGGGSVSLAIRAADATAGAGESFQELEERCKNAPRYGVNAKFLLLQAANRIAAEGGGVRFKPSHSLGGAAAAQSGAAAGSGGRAVAPQGQQLQRERGGPLTWKQLPGNLLDAVPKPETPIVAFILRTKVPRALRQGVANHLANQHLAMAAAARRVPSAAAAHSLVAKDAALRGRALKAALAQELDLYKRSATKALYVSSSRTVSASPAFVVEPEASVPAKPDTTSNAQSSGGATAEKDPPVTGGGALPRPLENVQVQNGAGGDMDEGPRAEDAPGVVTGEAGDGAEGAEEGNVGGDGVKVEVGEEEVVGVVEEKDLNEPVGDIEVGEKEEEEIQKGGLAQESVADEARDRLDVGVSGGREKKGGGRGKEGMESEVDACGVCEEEKEGGDAVQAAAAEKPITSAAVAPPTDEVEERGSAGNAGASDEGQKEKKVGSDVGVSTTKPAKALEVGKKRRREREDQGRGASVAGEACNAVAERPHPGPESSPEHAGTKTDGTPSDEEGRAQRKVKGQVAAFVRTVLDPFWASGTIARQDYKTVAQKVVSKVMSAHTGAKDASFLSREGAQIRKLVKQYLLHLQ